MKNEVTKISDYATNDQNNAHKNDQNNAHNELKNKDYKALFIIHQCVNPNNFEKVGDIES